MISLHAWIHIITVSALAMILKEYMNLRTIVHEEHRIKLWHSAPIPEPPLSRQVDDDTQLPPPQFFASNLLDEIPVNQHDIVAKRIEMEGSSVWCQGTRHTDRICKFRNICYLPSFDKFVFFHHQNGSILQGVPSNRFQPALLDWSTIENHNTEYFNYDDALAETASLLIDGATLFKSKTLIFKRFLPDNILHIFHDDLLPLFHTLQSLTGKSMANSNTTFDMQLVFMDDYNTGPYKELYSLFTYLRPVYKQEFRPPRKAACFVDATFGISKETTWYDYGFYEPQKPKDDTKVTGRHLRQFGNYMKVRLGVPTHVLREESHKPKLVFFSRKNNRLILNENDLILNLVQTLGVTVVVVSIEDMSVSAILEAVSSATMAIGMHGSIMSFIMFLPPGSLVIELFPYAIKAENYTPYKTLAEISGMNLNYRSWQNQDRNKTVPHPERSWQEGGINHLPLSLQNQLKSAKEVSPHICCRDPEFLYRIYQDTVVDVDAVVDIASKYLYESNVKQGHAQHISDAPALFPSEVVDLKCMLNLKKKQLMLSWLPSWNTAFLIYNKLEYEVLIRENGLKVTDHSFFVRMTTYIFDAIKSDTKYSISVRTVLNGNIQGPFNAKEITCDLV